MKKLMIMAAVMGATVATQAEIAVNWSMNDSSVSAYTAYVMEGSTDNIETLLLSKRSDKAQEAINILKGNALGSASTKDWAINNGQFSVNENDLGWEEIGYMAFANASYKTVLISDDETQWALGHIFTSFQKIEEEYLEPAAEFTFDYGWYDIVPEPTSGLLMLLGMAGLALKRKSNKA